MDIYIRTLIILAYIMRAIITQIAQMEKTTAITLTIIKAVLLASHSSLLFFSSVPRGICMLSIFQYREKQILHYLAVQN